ncbi:hypothetical protein PCASD_09382 [Puccinia coronata f. sp. avenae]|uniref:Uncharacterized protein n=1 Tax=Puccinia coronata f. sp. avenae TaxID=200324 RepID=A0A2N5V188_9BASI|nr:hypothetical protein PCASD_09382 [Puccinia coronata f. sp. avenae]
MGGRTAAAYCTSHSLCSDTEESLPSLSSVHRFKADHALDWSVAPPSEAEADGYLYLEDLILTGYPVLHA